MGNLKKIYLLLVILLCVVFCQGQPDSSYYTKLHKLLNDTSWQKTSGFSSAISYKDSCWWSNKIDTIQTDFVIIVDENNFVKKQRADFIVHKYENKDCQYLQVGFWAQITRNDVYLLDGKPVEVLLYRPKNQYGVLVGNSQ
jgi:hypothetical protein